MSDQITTAVRPETSGLSPDEVLASSEAQAVGGVVGDPRMDTGDVASQVERLLAVAQKQADDAKREIAGIEAETGRLRRRATLAWTALAAAVLLTGCAIVAFSASVSRAAANAQVQATLANVATEEARRVEDQLRVLEQEHAVALDRMRSAEEEVKLAREAVQAKVAEVARLEAEKRQAELALQAALATMYQQK